MKKQIVINAGKDRSRIAIVENGELVELYIETPDNVRSIGNIYLGRVQKVMPAIRAAFVDVGQKQDCFLHFSDLTDNFPQLLKLAGEDVPGLDEPVLSMAPAKRVADDDSEPDVEDALEVESAPEAKEESTTRRRSRRRSRGRGRNRGRGRGAGREEEEEQEEAGEQDGGSRRRLPSVLDLSSGSKRQPTRTARPEPKPEPKAPEPKADEPTGNGPSDDSSDSAEPESKPSRSRRSTRAPKPAADEPDASTEAASGSPSADSDARDDQALQEDKPKRKRRGRRGRGRKTSTSDAPESTDSDAPTADARDSGESNSRRVRPKSAAADSSETSESDSPGGSEGRRDRRGGRSGRRVKPSSAPAPSEPTSEAAPQDSPDEGSGRRRLPSTLDLTGSAKPASSGRRPSQNDDDSADDRPSRDEPKGEGRSRRRSRGDSDDSSSSKRSEGRGRRSDSDSDGSDSKTKDSSDSKGSGRSRRRPSRDSDASDSSSSRRVRPTSADEPASDKDAGDDSRGGGRSRRGRSGDSGEGSESSGRGRDRGRSDKGRGRSDRGRGKSSSNGSASGRIPPGEELLRRNGNVIVKITKEAISNKGPRVSSDLSLAGRFLVLVPAADYVAVSKKIESSKERRRLRTLATSLKPDGFGVIVRTVAEGRDAKSLDTDLRLLADRWRKIERKLKENPDPPVLLYQDVNMVSSIIRDLFSDDFDRILVDDEKTFRNVRAYIKAVAPDMADKVEMYKGRQPVYRSLGIETQVEEAFSKRVNMKGGGYLFIETTEAMHVVDVNSGRAGRGKSQKQNLIDVNVAAAKEVAKQLRLRDLGGIVVVDFIDLRYDRDRRKVTDALKKEFEKDRAVTKLLPMSDFGLVQITRQRLRPSITTQSTDEDGQPLDAADAMAAAGAAEIPRTSVPAEPAPEAEVAERPARDSGRDERLDRPALAPEDATPRALSARLRGWLDHYRQTVDERYKGRPIVVRVHPLFGAFLRRGFPSPLTRWRLALRGITFSMEEDATVDPLVFDVRDQKSGRSLLKKYSA